jgi:hypothetical protein
MKQWHQMIPLRPAMLRRAPRVRAAAQPLRLLTRLR